jgi:hypothetical protein
MQMAREYCSDVLPSVFTSSDCKENGRKTDWKNMQLEMIRSIWIVNESEVMILQQDTIQGCYWPLYWT